MLAAPKVQRWQDWKVTADACCQRQRFTAWLTGQLLQRAEADWQASPVDADGHGRTPPLMKHNVAQGSKIWYDRPSSQTV